MAAMDEDLPDFDEQMEPTRKTAMRMPRRGSNAATHASGFKDFLLKLELLRAIVDCGLEHPSEVQHGCITQAILGTDVLCQAKSGMGKTAVFVLACLQQLDATEKAVKVLVVCHTREWAYQIKQEFDRFSKHIGNVSCDVVYGGVPLQTDKEMLTTSPPHVLIGTRGRVLTLCRSKHFNVEKVTQLVLDECDKCLDKLDMRKSSRSASWWPLTFSAGPYRH